MTRIVNTYLVRPYEYFSRVMNFPNTDRVSKDFELKDYDREFEH